MILSHIISITIILSSCILLLTTTVHLTRFVSDYQYKQQTLSQWQRAMVILQRDVCNTHTYIWQGGRLVLGRATWYYKDSKIFRHDGKSRHAIVMISDAKGFRIEQGIITITCNNKEYRWPIICSR